MTSLLFGVATPWCRRGPSTFFRPSTVHDARLCGRHAARLVRQRRIRTPLLEQPLGRTVSVRPWPSATRSIPGPRATVTRVTTSAGLRIAHARLRHRRAQARDESIEAGAN